jgi:hypothetical protein
MVRALCNLAPINHVPNVPKPRLKNANNHHKTGHFPAAQFELWFDVQTTPEQKLIAVKAGFDIACGSDTMLLVFAPEGDSWKEVLRWQSQPYKTVAGAFEAFDYGISPSDESGN